jgi:predicted PurR-regulated permease PerM
MKVEWNNKYKTVSVYIIITFLVCLLIGLFFVNINLVGQGLAVFFNLLMPFIIGCALAYLLSRPTNFIEKYLFAFIDRNHPHPAARRNLSILAVYIIIFTIIIFLFMYIIPQLIASLGILFSSMPGYIAILKQSIIDLLKSANLYSADVQKSINDFFASFLDVTKYFDDLIVNAGTITTQIGSWLFKIVVGIIVSVYILANTKKFGVQAKKLAFSIFPQKYAKRFIQILHFSSDIFIKYVIGTLLDALIIGTITFAFLSIFGFPYPLLIAVIVGVTNIIPFFGPFIGAIPSAIIIFVVNPIQALWFIIFIVVLQQIDGNIIMPHIVGQTTKLHAFWVLFALILGGGLFGPWGLILGVPVWAVVYSLISAAVNKQLKDKEIPEYYYMTLGPPGKQQKGPSKESAAANTKRRDQEIDKKDR